MILTTNKIGQIYRNELANKLRDQLGACYYNHSWLNFSDKKRFFTRYSKYHSDQDCYFYGIEKDIWQKWSKADHLLFLMPPEGYENKIASKIKYIILLPQQSIELFKHCSQDYNAQKKINIYFKRSHYEISNYPFHHSTFQVSDLEIKSFSTKTDSTASPRKENRVIIRRKTESFTDKKNDKRRPLFDYLQGTSQDQSQVSLTFKQLSRILGTVLPASAYEQTWWWNRLKKQLSETGWKIENIYLKGQIITIRRTSSDYLTNIKKYVRAIVDGTHSVYSLDTATLNNWLRYCRRNSLFFEGTVLYERAFMASEQLTETERQEIEEHYQVCKREILGRGTQLLVSNEDDDE